MTATTEQQRIDLLDRARQGDGAALDRLLREVQPQLFRFSMKMCRHTEDAEDVLQESMMTLARSFRDFRGASSLSTWLFTVARSYCIKKRRKPKHAPKQEESLEMLGAGTSEGFASSDADPLEQAQDHQVWEQIQSAINSLDPIYREVLVLRDIEGLRAPEVAEIVEISVAAVKSRLHRARAQLRAVLAPEPGPRAPAAQKASATCPDIRTIFSRFLEDELAPDVCSTMEAHVANCTNCAAECEALNATLQICRTAPCDIPSGPCLERIDQAIREALNTLENQK